jgi:peroxiredoxin/glutaredoxin
MSKTTASGSAPIILYRLQACPFCESVARTLRDLDLAYDSRFVEALHSERDEVKRKTGVRTVPAIVDENSGVTMAESGNIIEYLHTTYGDPADADSTFEVKEFDETDYPRVGETAPDFVRPLVNGEYWEDVALSELTPDGPVLLVFHSMDGAFPGTYIWNEISDRAWDDRYDVTLVGLSISTPNEHLEFVQQREIDYRLFSDPQNGVAETYDLVNDLDGMTGVSEARPAIFLLDEDRIVQYVWTADQWPELPDYDDIGEALEATTSGREF